MLKDSLKHLGCLPKERDLLEKKLACLMLQAQPGFALAVQVEPPGMLTWRLLDQESLLHVCQTHENGHLKLEKCLGGRFLWWPQPLLIEIAWERSQISSKNT